MPEIWDAYFKDGSLAGIDLTRGAPIPKGIYHLVSEILVRHLDGDYLLMQRDPKKPNFGGYYEATAGGSALKGESACACAQRELAEETGIRAARLEELSRCTSKNTLYCNFLCTTDWDKSAITLQEGETIGYKWVSEQEFIAFIHSDKIIPTQKERYLSYFSKMGYLG